MRVRDGEWIALSGVERYLGWGVLAIARFLAKLGMTPGQDYRNDQILSRDPRTQPVCHAERNGVESKFTLSQVERHLRRAPPAIARFLALLGMTGGQSLMKVMFR